MKILVIGGTGTIGSQVVRNLVGRGEQVRVLTHAAAHTPGLPQGVEVVIGDLTDPGSLGPAFQGIDELFMVLPVSPDETKMGLTAVQAAKNSSCKRIVYSSVIMPPGSEVIPHFRSKIPIENAVKDSGIEWTILRPTNFYQNDVYVREVMLQQGVYPMPVGDLGVNRVDTRDIADAAVNALTQAGHTGKTFDVGGPENFTGAQTAEIWSRHLGRQIRYIGDDLDVWAREARKMLPESMVHDFKIMFQYSQEHGLPLPPEAVGPLRSLVGHEPRTFDAFAGEVASEWKARV